MILQDKYVFKDETKFGVEELLYNVKGDLLIVQVTGDASEKTVHILGTTDTKSEETFLLEAINMTDYSVSSIISQNGIYQMDISALKKIIIRIDSLVGGKISITASTKEA